MIITTASASLDSQQVALELTYDEGFTYRMKGEGTEELIRQRWSSLAEASRGVQELFEKESFHIEGFIPSLPESVEDQQDLEQMAETVNRAAVLARGLGVITVPDVLGKAWDEIPLDERCTAPLTIPQGVWSWAVPDPARHNRPRYVLAGESRWEVMDLTKLGEDHPLRQAMWDSEDIREFLAARIFQNAELGEYEGFPIVVEGDGFFPRTTRPAEEKDLELPDWPGVGFGPNPINDYVTGREELVRLARESLQSLT